MTTTQTDNARLASKLALRRYFLDRYHLDTPPRVFDCCQGSGVIWRHLMKDFSVEQYWGVDIKPKRGRVKIKSERVLEQPGWEFDVIDVDTYGDPWAHWNAILETAHHPVTVFLTIGNVRVGGGSQMSKAATAAFGLNFKRAEVAMAIKASLLGSVTKFCLGRALDRFDVVECMEAERGPRARYIGIRLAPHS